MRANFKVQDFFKFKEDKTFDQIYAIALLHHIPSFGLRLKFCQKVHHFLKKEGFFFVTVWNLWQKRFWPLHFKYTFLKIIGKSPLDFKDILVPWKDNQGQILTQRYYHAFTVRELKKLFSQADFKIEKSFLKGPNLVFILKK
jgi:SAM-dependent methyltransferase